MLRNRLYYLVKPLFPRRFRHAVRGIFARRKLEAIAGEWPVLPGSERKPDGWPGWPEGKQFSFVLTHDVEGKSGLDKIRKLAAVEAKHGFRSSFNLIPEGEYEVPRDLREELTSQGFEVGVHDLHHDGKLFQSRGAFERNALRINDYLCDWKAVGFRAGFMLHNLDWQHALNVEYDLSTYDTDPFEPQPDPKGTIFPFWKADENGGGYVEMPYTLVQDSTLFLLLKEKSAAIWTKKLDWVASQGGMALVNVHPDYIHFPGDPEEAGTFPVEHYEELLRHVRAKYEGRVWQPLPKDLASWFKKTANPAINAVKLSAKPAVANTMTEPAPAAQIDFRENGKPSRVAVVLYGYYWSDARPRRETETLVKAGMEADVICLRADESEPLFESVNGVNIHRVPMKHRRAGALTYAWQYGTFFLASFWRLSLWSFKRRYKLVHVHNMPDFLVFSSITPRLFGAKVILDLHDPMPELFCGISGVDEKHFLFRFLRFMEQRSVQFADEVLTPNISFHTLFASRNKQVEKFKTIMNSPDMEVYDPERAKPVAKTSGKRPFRMMYHGLLVERHGLHLAIDAIARLRGRAPEMTLDLYGEKTAYVDRILSQVEELELQEAVRYHGCKTQEEIAQLISEIDLGLVPNRLNQFTAINFPTRIFEFLAMGKPVIVPRTRGIQDYFGEDEILYFEADNTDDLEKKIEWASLHPTALAQVTARGRDVYLRHCWNVEKGRLVAIVDDLIKGRNGASSATDSNSTPRVAQREGALPSTSAT